MSNNFCSKCGAQIHEGQKFCIRCGNKLIPNDSAVDAKEAINTFAQPKDCNSKNAYTEYYSDLQKEENDIIPQNNIIDSIKLFFKNTFVFKGRTRRSDFFQSVIPVIAVYLIGLLITGGNPYFCFGYIIILATPLASIIVRRLHDTGKHGLFILLVFLGPIGFVALFVLCLKDSDENDNEYGKCTKYIQSSFVPKV
ncbi:MAG: DUF805 domain-containing protein [Eubacterium sp.]